MSAYARHLKRRLALVGALLAAVGLTWAFTGWKDPLATAITSLQRYLNEFTPEKIYIATDRPFYAAGEILWFKAWMVNGVDHKADSPSQTLYAELVSPGGQVVLSHVLQARDGGVAGDFYLPTNLEPGVYTLRAYTGWMQNFDDAWIFRRDIRVLRQGTGADQADVRVVPTASGDSLALRWILLNNSGQPLANSEVELAVTEGRNRLDRTKLRTDERGAIVWNTFLKSSDVTGLATLDVAYRDGRDRITYAVPVPQVGKLKASFMPEGGDLVAGVGQKVAFKVTDAAGRGVPVSGKLMAADGTVITELKDAYNGMGYVVIQAEPDSKYKAEFTAEDGRKVSVDLPPVLPGGVALRVDLSDPEFVRLQITSRGETPDVTLIGHTRGKLVFSGNAAASADGFVANVPRSGLPAGITHFTVFDGLGIARAERLVFIPPTDKGTMSISTDKEAYGKREKVTLSLDYRDGADAPLAGDFAVSVVKETDGKFADAYGHDIESYLLLTSDLRGYVENPGYYFSGQPSAATHADLLMLTHGWRRFDWKKMGQGEFPHIKNIVEQGLIMRGTYVERGNRKPIKNENFTIVMDTDNPSYYTVTSDKDGKFVISELFHADSTKVLIEGDDKGGRRGVDFVVEPFYAPHTDSDWFPALPSVAMADISNSYALGARDRLAVDRSFGLFNDSRLLGEVVVEAPRQTPQRVQEQDFEAQRIYGRPDRTYKPTPNDLSRGGNVLDYLRGRTGAFQISGSGANARVTSARNASFTSSTVPLMLLDGSEVDVSVIARMSITDVEAIDLLTDASTTVIFGVRGANGVISVFSRRGGGEPAPVVPLNTITRRVGGYYQVRTFYAPDYSKPEDIHKKPDSRATLWWAHTVKTNSEGKASISFYTSDDAGIYKIRLEGIDAKGAAVVKEASMTVR